MKKNTQNILILVLSLITVACLCVTGWAVFLWPAQTSEQDYAPVELEPNALPADEDVTAASAPQEMDKGSGHVTLSYTKEIDVHLSSRTVDLYYQNPSSSYNNVSVQVVLVDRNGNEAVIAQSGLLEPGTKVTTLSLSKDVNLQAGSYDGRYELSFYDPKSGEKAVVNGKVENLVIDVS